MIANRQPFDGCSDVAFDVEIGELMRVQCSKDVICHEIVKYVCLEFIAGADVHKHYFERKGVTDLRQQELIRSKQKGQYTAFGIVAFLFSLTPVVNYGLFYANIAGAALWAADIEVSLLIPGSGRFELGHFSSLYYQLSLHSFTFTSHLLVH